MVVLIVLVTVLVFILVNFATRLVMKRIEENRVRREREEALDIGLRLEFTDEARSLKRVAVDNPRAKILAVDDEPVVLDSFRKILVLHGYSVDTVETGREAVGLVQKNDYDFVFTDLKMPEFDGLEVTKAVKHLRPDIDVVMITGYATIESAVAAMKYGALDYVQKPFTEDELAEFVKKTLVRREARIESEMPPQLHLLETGTKPSEEPHVINVAGGLFVTPEHSWLGLQVTGEIKVGIDDLCAKVLRGVDRVDLPRREQRVRKGEPLFTLHGDGEALTFTSPVNGGVSRVNDRLLDSPDLLTRRPYHLGWVCCLDAKEHFADMHRWTLGGEALDWYRKELDRYRESLRETAPEGEPPAGEPPADASEAERSGAWSAYRRAFLKGAGRQERGDEAR